MYTGAWFTHYLFNFTPSSFIGLSTLTSIWSFSNLKHLNKCFNLNYRLPKLLCSISYTFIHKQHISYFFNWIVKWVLKIQVLTTDHLKNLAYSCHGKNWSHTKESSNNWAHNLNWQLTQKLYNIKKNAYLYRVFMQDFFELTLIYCSNI